MLPHVLQLTEGVTHQRVALRVEPTEIESLGQALELFLKEPKELVETGVLPRDGVESYLEISECLFTVVGDGGLGELHEGLHLYQETESVVPEMPLLFERRPVPGDKRGKLNEIMLADIVIDRRNCKYDRDWNVFHQRKIDQAKEELQSFLLAATTELAGRERAEKAIRNRHEEDKELLFRAAARRVFDAPFELYSRFVDKRRLIKDGLSTLRHVMSGDGGACSEKAQAIRLIADFLEIPASYVIAGPDATGEVPVDAMLEILETFEVEYSRAVQTYWNHIAVLATIGDREILVDASNGNIPFLWVSGDELEAMLDRRGAERRAVEHRYVVGADRLYYNRVDQLVPERLLYALELGWADTHIDLVQSLDDELGLLTMPDLWLGLLPFRTDEERGLVEDWYHQKWLSPGLIQGVLFTDDPLNAEGELASQIEERYPRAVRAASAGREYIEYRLEEANPGAGYHVEFVVLGRKE